MRELILQETVKIVTQNGIRSFTMDELAGSLGISKKTLYKYYRSKQELISELVDKTLDLEKELSQRELLKHTRWDAKLSALLSIYSYNDIPYRLMDELYRFFPKEREKIEEIADYRKQIAFELLEEGINCREIRQDIDPAALVLVLHKLFMTPTEEKFLMENRITVNSLMQQLKTLFFYGILNHKNSATDKEANSEANSEAEKKADKGEEPCRASKAEPCRASKAEPCRASKAEQRP